MSTWDKNDNDLFRIVLADLIVIITINNIEPVVDIQIFTSVPLNN